MANKLTLSAEQLRGLQLKELDLLKYFRDYCDSHGLTYYVCGGCLIGSLRYGGFIPWDDDADVFMPRADYEIFIKEYLKENPSERFVLLNETDETFTRNCFATLVDTSATLVKNYQKDFEVVAGIPEEKSALYVSRDCDIYDFTGDRIFTVIYRYNYTEPDDDGDVYRNVSERHILNIRVHFESGEPIIGELIAPAKMLPGTIIGLTKPSVQKGAFEVLGGGWELYENENNAINHKNGIPYNNYVTPMYWYQDNWYVAYYAETYLGRTFSNPVPFSIANYHDLDAVMADNTNHMYIDHPGVKANSRIYIDSRSTSSDNSKSKLDLLYDLFDLSLQGHGQKQLLDENGIGVTDNGVPVMIDDYDINYDRGGQLNKKHSALNEHVKGLDNLEFILKSDVEPMAYTDWTPIGTENNCFEGTLHGNGYTVSGIDKSLFGYLCGSVFNLGVRGAINGSGIAENGGYAQNVWLINDANIDLSGKKAIMGTGNVVNGYYNDESASAGYADGSNAIRKPMSAFLNGEELKLTPIEFKLLTVLAKNTGKVLTHTYITQNIWGRSWDNDISSLRVFMATLRRKLESSPDSPQYIQTHIGIGYRMLKVD